MDKVSFNNELSLYSLNKTQTALIVFLGVVFWYGAATAVRLGSPLGMFGPVNSLVSFAVGIPICWLSVLFSIKIAQLKAHQIVPGISLGLAVATFCDGVAITWLAPLYGTDRAQISLGAAWILWGVFAFILFAFIETYRQNS